MQALLFSGHCRCLSSSYVTVCLSLCVSLFAVLPFLQHDKLRPLLAGIVGVAFLAVLLTLFHFNVAKFALGWTVA
jgi:hypothetical protein